MTKVALADRIRTTVEIRSGFQTIEPGTEGHVFDTHATPDRSYLIDLGEGSAPRYTVLFPGEFEVVGRGAPDGPVAAPPDLFAPRLTAPELIVPGAGGPGAHGSERGGPEGGGQERSRSEPKGSQRSRSTKRAAQRTESDPAASTPSEPVAPERTAAEPVTSGAS